MVNDEIDGNADRGNEDVVDKDDRQPQLAMAQCPNLMAFS